MAMIQGLQAREILDSRGIPTVECTAWLDTGVVVVASVASGTSKGKYEAMDLRDNQSDHMVGQGVLAAVNNLNTIIAPLLIGRDPATQNEIDALLISTDGTDQKTKLGSNAMLAASLVVAKAAATQLGIPLYQYFASLAHNTDALTIPTCIYTMINGGQHGADNLDIQEFQIVPASFMDFPASLNMGVTMYHQLEDVLISKGAVHSIGLVGGFTPNLYNNTDAFELLVETTKASPYTFAQDIFFGVDMAASSLFHEGKYHLKDKAQPYSSKDLFDYYAMLRNIYQVFSIEDPFEDDDWKSWQALTTELGPTTSIVADSFLATNLKRVEKAIANKACNSISVKPNEAGTITETLDVIARAQAAGWQVVMSHRSGETNDDAIADLAVGVGADYCKFGPPQRGERVAKYNRLLQIHQELLFYQNQAATVVPAAPTSEAPPANS